MSAQSLIDQGYGGYAGWGNAEADADFAATGGSGKETQSAQPASSEEVTPYLYTFQDNMLQGLAETYAPTLAGGITGGAGLSTTKPAFSEDVKQKIYPGWNDDAAMRKDWEEQGAKKWADYVKSQQPKLPATTATTGAPQPISRIEEFERLRTEYNVEALEKYVNDLKAQEEFLYAELRSRTGAERGKPVPMGVISGRISKIEQQQAERIDTVSRLKARAVDELNTKYSIISTYIQFMGMDYQDAVQAYNDEFQRNVTIYGLMADARREQREEQRYQQQIASANLQTMVNAITSGNLNYNDLPADQKSLIRKLEAQAGLPAGFTSSLQMNPQDTMLFQSTSKGVTQVGFMQPDGTVKVESYGTPTGDGDGGNTKQQDYAEMDVILQKFGGGDNIVSGSQWAKARGDWVQQGYSAGGFDEAFRRYANPDWDTYLGIND